jgi:hypothetical protein
MRLSISTIALLGLLLAPLPTWADDPVVGFVKTLSGSVTLKRGDASEQVALGTRLQEKDEVDTGSDGRVGVTFRDDTRVALGPDSRLVVAHFVFKPADKQYGFVLSLARGTLEYISGLTEKLAPQSMTIEMPNATIAVRGTRLVARTGG